MNKSNAVQVDNEFYCPNCGKELSHFSGLEAIPEYLFCGDCNDAAYGLDGRFMAWLE